MVKTNEIVTPTVVDGVEFYVSSDGTQTGLSQSGLARLIGVSEATIRKLIDNLSRGLNVPNSLKDLAHKPLHHDLTSRQQAKVIKSEVAAKIIEYYAFEVDTTSPLALFAYKSFARCGVAAWIRSVVGYEGSPSDVEGDKDSLLKTLLAEVQHIRGQLAVTAGYRAAVPQLPGLQILTDSYDPKNLSLPSVEDNELYTLVEWLQEAHPEEAYHVISNRQAKHILANNVGVLYKSLRLEPPEKVARRNSKGLLISPVAAYPRRHFGILETAYQEMLRDLERKHRNG